MNFYQDKSVLVTGAAGFIGSHLVDALLVAGAHVVGIDNFITGKKQNLELALQNPKFTFLEADIIDSPSSYLAQSPVPLALDCIFHLASPASPIGYQQHPVETYLVNSIGTHNLLQYVAANHKTARFLFTSTSEAYGDPLEHPQKETYWGNVNPNGPRSMYDESKRLGETICGVHTKIFAIDTRIARLFNTYGPRLDINDGRVIPDFIKSVRSGSPLTIHGDGTQTRSFCFVSDTVDALLRFMEREHLAGETINIGNPEEVTINTVADLCCQIASVPKQISFLPARTDDPHQRCPDISKAKRELSWEPVVDLQLGLTRTIHSFSQL